MIGIITALPKEYAAVELLLEQQSKYSVPGAGVGRQYTLGEIPAAHGGTHQIVLALLSSMGTGLAATQASRLLEHFPQIRLILMVGIAGGIPSPETPDDHVRLGDIVVSDQYGVIQYDSVKKTNEQTLYRPFPRPPSADLLVAARLLEAGQMTGQRPWQPFIIQSLRRLHITRPPKETDILTLSGNPAQRIIHPKDRKRRAGQPRAFLGAIASSNTLLKDAHLRDELRDRFHVKAFEMEGAGIADATWDQGANYLVIRGICDYGDANKTDTWQEYAAVVAASYTRALLQSIPTSQTYQDMPVQPIGGSGAGQPTGRPFLMGSMPLLSSSIWNIPYTRNSVFTGREAILSHLATAFSTEHPPPQAISGLGGIGKTQIAVEYAYQHRQNYQAVLWVSAESREMLIGGYIEIARLLLLPQKDEPDQARIVQSVLQWLRTQTRWLLILDNADNLAIVREFLPSVFGGHILLTTRAQAMGRLAQHVEVEAMEENMGVHLLLRRAALISDGSVETLESLSHIDVGTARKIVQELGGLPLALDQAGAYIEETQCRLTNYQRLYREQRATVLKERGGLVTDHPEAVATTWSLAFQKVEESNPAAAELLRFCAFLHADAIPEEFLVIGVEHLEPHLRAIVGDSLAWNNLMRTLRAYSLIRRDAAESTLHIHRLVQAVLKDALSAETLKCLGEQVVRVVNAAFPNSEFATWELCERYLSHALVCASLIQEEDMAFPDAASLLNRVGWYLKERARYSEAEPLIRQGLAIYRRCQEAASSVIANSLSVLGRLYHAQGKLVEAEPALQRALEIEERAWGVEHLAVTTHLNNLADLYRTQGKYERAEALYRRACIIQEKQLGPGHPQAVRSLGNLALLHQVQGKYKLAEELYRRIFALKEKQLGPDHPDIAQGLNNLALLYHAQGEYELAEALYKRAFALQEKQLGLEHPHTLTSRNNLANLYHTQGRYELAEALYRNVLLIREQRLGVHHPDTAISLTNLANFYHTQGKYEQAEPVYLRALAILEEQLGPEHPDIAQGLNNLALLYRFQEKYEQAESLYRRALTIWKRRLGLEHPDIAQGLNNLALLYHSQGKYKQAEALCRRAFLIWEKQLGPEHPYTLASRKNLVSLYISQGKYEQAEALMSRHLTRE